MTTEFEREIRAAFAETIPARADPALAASIRVQMAETPVVRHATGPLFRRSGRSVSFLAAVFAAVVMAIVAAPLIGQLRPPTPSANPGQVVGASPSPNASTRPAPGTIPLHPNMFGDVSILQVRLVTDTVGWVATSTGLYRTADDGKTWTEVRVWPKTPAAATSVDLIDADSAYVGAGTRVAVTHDGGASWSEATLAGESTGSLGYGPILTFRTPLIGAATFESTDPAQPVRLRVFETTDGGRTWVDRGTSALPDGEPKLAPIDGQVLSLNEGKADNKPFNDRLWLSTDGGLTWKHRTFPIDTASPAGVLKWVAGAPWIGENGQIVLPISNGDRSSIYESSDDGQSWRLIDDRAQPTQGTFHGDFAVQLRSATDWVLAARDGSEIWSTTDGGGDWRLVTGQAPIWRLSPSWASQDHAWAVHDCARNSLMPHGPDPWCDGTDLASVLFETTDGGRTWRPIGG